MNFLIAFVVALALQVIAYLIMPKPKQPKTATKDLEYPTAEAGRPIPKVWGKITITGPNILWYGEKDIYKYKVKV